ncbi:MAG: bifunctional phosphopantothenoylcysteine decarboxylase/phosphopantothenate--cysteine ligase CoaBC [Dehalococcoidia bacterium]|nr:bifunctional phosphopantothenoylcysteine decarboxylase/phosphopantothenate--cysteine ligase CoaBC [Dehalococcoidia bacterium]
MPKDKNTTGKKAPDTLPLKQPLTPGVEQTKGNVLRGKNIVLGITGSIAAYKAADLASKLTQAGAAVNVIMTEEAREFITPLCLESLTRRPVVTDMFKLLSSSSPHVSLGGAADIMVIAPATANIIAKITSGIGDDVLTCTVLATKAPLLIAPAMHTAMYQNPATRDNIARLKERGVSFIGPVTGALASGDRGPGRFPENIEIIGAIRQILGKNGDLAGKRIVVTAGGTQEPVDAVRYISNRSSGKMGYSIAAAARDRGAMVTLVTAPTALPLPYGNDVVQVATALEMKDAVVKAAVGADVLVMAAAVADFRPARPAGEKIKKKGTGLTLKLTLNPDILSGIKGKLVKVGFAAESVNLVENAKDKLHRKGLHLIVGNDITESESGFGSDQNRVIIIGNSGTVESFPLLPKEEIGHLILDRVVALLN